MAKKELTKEEKKDLRLEILEKMTDLATAGFGLVAALAWNDAIKAVFTEVFPSPTGGIIAKVGYALVITSLVVVITIQLGRTVNVAKNQLGGKRK